MTAFRVPIFARVAFYLYHSFMVITGVTGLLFGAPRSVQDASSGHPLALTIAWSLVFLAAGGFGVISRMAKAFSAEAWAVAMGAGGLAVWLGSGIYLGFDEDPRPPSWQTLARFAATIFLSIIVVTVELAWEKSQLTYRADVSRQVTAQANALINHIKTSGGEADAERGTSAPDTQ